jgi:hypothetical protein
MISTARPGLASHDLRPGPALAGPLAVLTRVRQFFFVLTGRMASKDSIQAAMTLFSKYDRNGNGEVSKDELKAMLVRKCEDEGVTPDLQVLEVQASTELVVLCDYELVSYHIFIWFQASRLFEELDNNGDGSISPLEFIRQYQKFKNSVKACTSSPDKLQIKYDTKTFI